MSMGPRLRSACQATLAAVAGSAASPAMVTTTTEWSLRISSAARSSFSPPRDHRASLQPSCGQALGRRASQAGGRSSDQSSSTAQPQVHLVPPFVGSRLITPVSRRPQLYIVSRPSKPPRSRRAPA